jgi:hypothetical protein
MAAPWSAGAQARIVGELHGQQTINVLNFATNTQPNDTDFSAMLIQLAEALRDCVVESLLPAVTQNWTFKRIECQLLSPNKTNPLLVTGTNDNVGELSVVSVSFASSLVTINTAFGGRSGSGRFFLPPPGEAETADSEMDGPTLVLLAAFLACVATKFMSANATTPWRLGVLSRKLAGANLANFDAGFHEAVGLHPHSTISCTRSRKKGHGN